MGDYYSNGEIIRNISGEELKKELLQNMAVAFDDGSLYGLPGEIQRLENKGEYVILTLPIVDANYERLGKQQPEEIMVSLIADKDTKIPTVGKNVTIDMLKEETVGFMFWIKIREGTQNDTYPKIDIVEIYDK